MTNTDSAAATRTVGGQLPAQLDGLRLPAISAPMFLTSNPDLVVEVCRSGLVGTLPALNLRSTAALDEWLSEIEARLGRHESAAPYGINLIVNKSNDRLEADLDMVVKHKVPLVITSLGAASSVVDAVHSYGGLVFHDVINLRHAQKAAEVGVDGIIAVCAGAGGHGGLLSPFALIPEIRAFFDGVIVLSGAISTGAQIAAAEIMGADLAYLGTRFIATQEAMASKGNKDMILQSAASDIIYTSKISGVNANFLRPSIEAAGVDPDKLAAPEDFRPADRKKQVWKDIWSAGQGVGSIHDIPTAAELCERLIEEYEAALLAATKRMASR